MPTLVDLAVGVATENFLGVSLQHHRAPVEDDTTVGLTTPLPAEIGNRLLKKIKESGKLDDETMRLFRPEFVTLTQVDLSECALEPDSLSILGEHRLEAANLHGVSLRLPFEKTPSHRRRPPSSSDEDEEEDDEDSPPQPTDTTVEDDEECSRATVGLDGRRLRTVLDGCLRNAATRTALKLLDIGGNPTLCQSSFQRKNGSGSSGVRMDQISSVGWLCRFGALASLTVSDMPFSDEMLAVICEHLSLLEYLDISRTAVTRIEPLLELRKTLRVLLMHRVPLVSREHAEMAMNETDNSNNDDDDVVNWQTQGPAAILTDLPLLEVLDISDQPGYLHHDMVPSNQGLLGRQYLDRFTNPQHERVCSRLSVLDLSGNHLNTSTDGIDESERLLQHFLQLIGPQLRFLGLCWTNIGALNVTQNGGLEVAGEGTLTECLCALETYGRMPRGSRELFCIRALHRLYDELHTNYEHLPVAVVARCLQHLHVAMRTHVRSISVQMAGSASYYHLIRSNRATLMDRSALKSAVERCLDAVDAHRKILQLHKNVWLTLCNDFVLVSEVFDQFRCCHLALESMVENPDPMVTRMTVAIVSVLAAKIPTSRLEQVGTDRRYMRFLLLIILRKLNDDGVANQGVNINPDVPDDVTLKFTLSALWNLTDESPSTCAVFVSEGGMSAALRVLGKYPNYYSVQTKVLGLLNNIAEVTDLRPSMVSEQCVTEILLLLASNKLDVSYFAAGILSNLLLVEPWTTSETTRDYCINQLTDRVESWPPPPEQEMVAYRSFRPFFPLLNRDDLPGAQLWALWALRHVCTHNPQKYQRMFADQGGLKAVEILTNTVDNCSKARRPLICSLASEILHLMTEANEQPSAPIEK